MLHPPCRPALACLALWAGLATAAEPLSYDDAQWLAIQSPAVDARHAALTSANFARRAAGLLPDPRLVVAVENVPVNGADRFTIGRDSMTMRRIGIEQDMPRAAKRDAAREKASALEWREHAALATERLRAQHEAAVAWLARHYAERKLGALQALEGENKLLLDTLPARVAAGTATAEQSTVAKLERATLADRRDQLQRERDAAQAMLRRWIGDEADRPLGEGPPALEVDARNLRERLGESADLARFAPDIALAEAELREAEAARQGDWRWGVSYAQRGRPYDNMVSVQLGIDLPLRSEQRQVPLQRAKEKDVERLRAEQEDALRDARAKLESQLAALEDVSRRLARLKETALPLADERVRLALAAYAGPRGVLAEVLTARRERTELQLRAIELEAEREQVRATLHHWLVPPRR